jgi:heptosyltransferase-2
MAGELRDAKFDLAILFQNAFEAALLVRWAGIPLRLGYRRYGRGPLLTHAIAVDGQVAEMHQAYYYLALLSGAGLLEPERQRPPLAELNGSLGVRSEDRQAARALLRDCGIREGELLVGLNAGASYGGAKRWLPDRFAAVANHFAATRGARIVLLGSEQERTIAETVAAAMAPPPVNLAGRTTLGQLMALIRECSLLVTNDSGPMHLAGALDVPQVAIFGSTSEIATGPLGARSKVLRHPVDCSPCFLRECPIDFRCMTGISAATVIEAAERLLLATRAGPGGMPRRHNAGSSLGNS